MFTNLLPLLSRVVSPDWTITKNISYGSLPVQKADFYQLNKGVHPAVILIHGGGWMVGDKSVYEGTARQYALAGFHVFAIDYTLAKDGAPETQWDAQLRDVEAFVRWLRNNAAGLRVDPNRLVAYGTSAGGHLSLFLATSKDPMVKVSAVLNNCGPTDLAAPEMRFTLSTTPVLNRTTDKTILQAASPVTYVDHFTAPICTIHGKKDTVVDYTQATILKKRLDDNGVYNQLLTHDYGHGYDNAPWYIQKYLDMKGIWFLQKFV